MSPNMHSKIEHTKFKWQNFMQENYRWGVGGCVNCQAAPKASATCKNDVVECVLIIHQ